MSTSSASMAPRETLLSSDAQRRQNTDPAAQTSSPTIGNGDHHLLTTADTWPHAGRDFKSGRRLIVGCDGTWLNSDSQNILPSNVTRLCRALNVPNSAAPQIVYYHRGMGTDGGAEVAAETDKYVNGPTGATIEEHVRESYGFLVNNYHGPSDAAPGGDEIFLFGFSRGAYTVRVLATLISDVGMLTSRGMEYFSEIFEDWKNMNATKKDVLVGSVKSGVFKGLTKRPKMPSDEYRIELYKRGYTNDPRTPVPIRAIGVFDTVGHLGIPPVLGLHLTPAELIQFSFVNTKVAQSIQHAFQALALDDHRASYSPTLWELPDEPHNLQTLKQTWFPGVHCNIGGSGYEDESLANASLAWMVGKIIETESAAPMLDFDIEYLKWVFQHDIDICKGITIGPGNDNDGKSPDPEPGFRGWARGRMEETDVGIFAITGDRKPLSDIWEHKSWLQGLQDWWDVGDVARTPGRYTEIDAKTGLIRVNKQPLSGTGEHVHSSARVRLSTGGRGLDDTPPYVPKGLGNFKVVSGGKGDVKDPLAEGYTWVGKGLDGKQVVLSEEPLGKFEQALLSLSQANTGKK